MVLFLDANIPMYASGGGHPLQASAVAVLAAAGEHPESFITDAEVLQEILHRYRSQRLWGRGRLVFEEFGNLMSRSTIPVTADDVRAAARLGEEYHKPDARDLIHIAIMIRRGISDIVSADRGFDDVSGIERLDPSDIATIRVRASIA